MMKELILILMGITIALDIADFIIMWKYCTAGFWGYEDEWSSDKAEKAHYILLPIILAICLMLTIIVNYRDNGHQEDSIIECYLAIKENGGEK